MQITNKFTLAVHIICATEYFKNKLNVTSSLLSSSTGANPVVVRTIMSSLKEAGILDISQGKTGIGLKRPITEINLFDVYKAVDSLNKDNLFHFHDDINMNCPVGKNIHYALDGKLIKIQESMYKQMQDIKISDVYVDLINSINKGV